MSSGPETRFIASVHRLLPPVDEFHREKMANPYRGGTADSWYSGNKRDLWIEWKWVELPKRPDTMIDITAGKKPSLSVLQQDWIAKRRAEGRDVWIIIGSAEGGMVLVDDPKPRRTDDFISWCLPKKRIAELILEFCQ